MAFSQGYVFGFATAVCVVCSLAIASLSLGLRDLQQANARRDTDANILMALGLNDGTLRGEDIDRTMAEKVEIVVLQANGEPAEGAAFDLDGDGDVDIDDVRVARDQAKATNQPPKLLSVYRRDDGTVALPMNGVGLWGPISGYIAVDARAQEITGVTFFAPKETPGLGAEIAEDDFEQQWIGKRIVDDSGRTVPVRVVKGEAAVVCPDDIEHCVDGLSGATITGRGVDEMIRAGLVTYEPYLTRLRGGAR